MAILEMGYVIFLVEIPSKALRDDGLFFHVQASRIKKLALALEVFPVEENHCSRRTAMSLLEKILGPKSKYDASLPYTYEARIPVFEGGEEYNSYFADTICGLVEYLDKNKIKPDEVQIFEIFQKKETPIDPKLLTTADHQWLFRPDMCRSFEEHYKGHIQENSCSFNDRDCKGSGP